MYENVDSERLAFLSLPDLSILLIGLLCVDCMTESVIIHAGKGKTY